MSNNRIKIVALSANVDMANAIAKDLGVELLPSELTHFADGEILFTGKKSFRGDNVYIIQSTCSPVNERLMELLICIDACKRASAKSITCIIPYFGYARQDRKAKPRQPISAKRVANMITIAGANRVVSSDFHASQVAGFFDIPVDDVSPVSLFYRYFKDLNLDDIVCVSPDHGGLVRTFVGDVKDKTCIIVDDIVDTAGTLILAINKLHELGAKKIYAAISHGVLSNDAVKKIENSPIDKLVITDSIPLSDEKKSAKIDVVSLAPLFSKISLSLDEGRSLYETHQEFISELMKG